MKTEKRTGRSKRDELMAELRRKHKEDEKEKSALAEGMRETVIGAWRDQYRQF